MSRILTTHVGSLPRPDSLREANAKMSAGEMSREDFQAQLDAAVADVVKKQHDIGIDILNDGEYGHMMKDFQDYGSWWTYSFTRMSGLEYTDEGLHEGQTTGGGAVELTTFNNRRDWVRFKDAYTNPESGIYQAQGKEAQMPTITGPVKYTGHDDVKRDVEFTLQALRANGLSAADGFIAALSPGSAARISNTYYKTENDILFAMADALHEEYKIITDAGLTVQIDDPSLAEGWDQINPEPPVEDYRKWVEVRIEAINAALEGINPEQVRLHVCWGSWHGPHTTDIPFIDIVDKVLKVNARGISFEAANVRHAHEWKIWREVELPEDKVLIPGMVSHSTNVVEHPELVADRIQNFTDIVGPDRVIASTDCGFGGRIFPSIAWAKLEALTEGAQIASKRLR
ncbi:vitamin-B12 independent methionine synthase [Actinobaculum suis]|uniref:Vitamin-B12 independent methionine synthase n=1 Tax=Actinobaculum suis TaxID=1657 RepID=A0A0K9ERH9_9ACTO|nr:cobalamin-independent methionine synthase II family protein [Actinobaculum suis]KMY22793.1 methionine synthase [Actinobaculum suis]OCA93130.1 methionine synthase [Actinobaculum suis]OCA93228.1 methionine synthase [Actinobaculum suis]VDG75819.1 vitamin-B12 independent methionine synthase [Actinobaculum suis]